MTAVWFDSNAVEMTTAQHYMYLMKFRELVARKWYWSLLYSFGEVKFIFWNLHICLFNYLSCDVSNLQELEQV